MEDVISHEEVCGSQNGVISIDYPDLKQDEATSSTSGIDVLATIANHPGLSQVHRRDATSTMYLLDRFKEEAKDADEMVPDYRNINHVVDHTWDIIISAIQKRIFQNCDHDNMDSGLHKIKIRQPPQFREVFTSEKEKTDFMQYARMFTSLEKPILGIVSLYACANESKLNAKGDSSVDQIQKCSWLLTFAFQRLSEDENVYSVSTRHLIPFLSEELTKFIRSVQTSSHKFRTENEAWCLMRIGICHGWFNDDAKFVCSCENAISLLRRKFKKGARFHQVHATCLSNAAAAYLKCGNVAKAGELMNRSMEAFIKVRDWQGSDKDYALYVLKFNMKINENTATHSLQQSQSIMETEI